MSPRDWKDYIRDILNAIQEISLFTSQATFDSFRNVIRTIRAVELNFIIIGEARIISQYRFEMLKKTQAALQHN